MKASGSRFIFLGFLLRLFVAIWNGFFGPSFGADLDALTFHMDAVEFAHNSTLEEFAIGRIYVIFLGWVYFLTIDSLFLGSLLSCIAWLASALILANCLRILSVERSAQTKVMLIYALLPSSIMFTAVTIREAYQLLFVNIAIYAVLKIYLHKSAAHWFLLVAAIVGAGSLHGALLAFGILLFAGTLLLVSIRGSKSVSWSKIGLMSVIAVFFLWYSFSLYGDISYSLNGDLVGAVEKYQNNLLGVDARTHYRTDVQISSFGSFVTFMPVALIQYLFEPFPWHISAVSDIVSMLENILRVLLIWKVWKVVRFSSKQQEILLVFITFFYFVLMTIWSAGTVNWGTSIRHHIPAWGLLLLAAYTLSDGQARGNRIARYTQK